MKKADSVMNVLVTDRRRNSQSHKDERTDIAQSPLAKMRNQKGKTKQVFEFLKETMFKETKTTFGQHTFISQYFRKNRKLAIKRQITRGREFYKVSKLKTPYPVCKMRVITASKGHKERSYKLSDMVAFFKWQNNS